ncbi:MAG: GH3 auxin-responsive promoter family protein [Caldilineaceae bacterium]|nr:GH3 auxin-responsive promoter family protein [Caldilineaceae bacterium]
MAEATIGDQIVHLAGMPTWIKRFASVALGISGRSTLAEIWPNLCVTTVGGVNPRPYHRDLNRLILGAPDTSPRLLHSEVYNATEGFFAMQIDEGEMALIPDVATFYEFAPLQDAQSGNFSRAVPLEGVGIDQEYALILSNPNGLWRYLIGDTVRFTATRPHRLQVSGRINQSLNMTGEELLVANTDAAIGAVCQALGLSLADYLVIALKLEGPDENACHLWLVEVEGGAYGYGDSELAGRIAAGLDRELLAYHDYAKSRQMGAHSGAAFSLSPPVVILLPPGSFYRWLQLRFGEALSTQSKVPRLTEDREMVGELLRSLPADVATTWAQLVSPRHRQAITALLTAKSQGGGV